MPRPLPNLIGQRFGRLVVLERDYHKQHPAETSRWLCQCDCGKITSALSNNIQRGITTSCGCLREENRTTANRKFAPEEQETMRRLYTVWRNMLSRCENSADQSYHQYGGRGITVCDDWHDSIVFRRWAIETGWQDGLTIDRIDCDGNYDPSNCRWTTPLMQANNRRNSIFVAENLSLKDYCRENDLNDRDYNRIRNRLRHYQLPIADALTNQNKRERSLLHEICDYLGFDYKKVHKLKSYYDLSEKEAIERYAERYDAMVPLLLARTDQTPIGDILSNWFSEYTIY